MTPTPTLADYSIAVRCSYATCGELLPERAEMACIAKYDNQVQAEVFDLDELREKLSPRQAGLFGDAT